MESVLSLPIDHLGIAVYSLEEAEPYYRTLGMRRVARGEIPELEARTALFASGRSRIELLEPTAATSAVAAFLHRHGEGLHHVAFLCTNLRAELTRLRPGNPPRIQFLPIDDARALWSAFLPPKPDHRVATELCQRAAPLVVAENAPHYAPARAAHGQKVAARR